MAQTVVERAGKVHGGLRRRRCLVPAVMALRMRKWRVDGLGATVARRGALVLDYRRGKRSAHLWRTAHGSSSWVIQLIDNRHTVLYAHRWQDARRMARRHVGVRAPSSD